MSNMAIADRLKQIRECSGDSQRAFSERVGLKHRTWQEYESGNRVPGGVALQALSLHGYCVDWVLTGQGEMRKAESTAFLPGNIDQAALTEVIALIEEWLAANGRELAPAKRAEVIALAYEIATEDPAADKVTARNNVVRLLRVAS